MKNQLSRIIGLSFVALIFFLLAVASAQIGAAQEARPAIVDDAESDLRNNQERIAELRTYVEEFEALKTDNAVQIGRLQASGYVFDWETLAAKREPPKE